MEKQALTLGQIRALAKKMHQAGLHKLELHSDGWSLKLRYPERTPPLVAAAAAPVEKEVLPLRAPLPGKILLSHPCQQTAYMQPGQKVKHNELLALLKVGPLYLPLRSPTGGVVTSIRVQPNQAVEYGSEIALLTPDEPLAAAL